MDLSESASVTLLRCPDSRKPYALPQVGQQSSQNRLGPEFASDGQTVDRWPSNEDTLGPKAESLDDIHASANAGVEEDGHLVSNGIHDLRKDLE